MARGRKSTHIKILTYRDLNLLKQLANTGLCTIEQAKNFWNLNLDRLLKLQKSGYVKIEKTNPANSELIQVVRLKNKGKVYCKNKLGIKYFYNSSLRQATHDLKLTEAYHQVFSINRDFKWKNETEILQTHKDLLVDGKECVDAVVECGGEIFAIEVIGRKYTQQTIDNKVEVGNRVAGRTILI